MLARLFDKLIFAATLLLALQLPQLADHYQQYLAGRYEATRWQVAGYEATAQRYHYHNVEAMINHHLQNEVASVRADARQKQQTLLQYQQLQEAMRVFSQGNLLQKSFYMFTPSNYQTLSKTLDNFAPGIPLSVSGLTFGVVAGLVLNLLLTWPFLLLGKGFKRYRNARHNSMSKPSEGTLSHNTGTKRVPAGANPPRARVNRKETAP